MKDNEKKEVDDAMALGATAVFILFIFILALALLLRSHPNSNIPFAVNLPENVYGISSPFCIPCLK